MDRTSFINHIKSTYQDCLAILAVKNADYGKDSDPWANFKFAAIAGIGVDDAIMVRILDKMARISNLLHKEAAVKDETVLDTIQDAINYLAILLAWIEEEKKPKPNAFVGVDKAYTKEETAILRQQGQPKYRIDDGYLTDKINPEVNIELPTLRGTYNEKNNN